MARSTRHAALFCAGILGMLGCAPATGGDGSDSSDLSRTPAQVLVNGKSYDVEAEYLPRVVQCENPLGSTESLRVQAIAARTYLTYTTRGQATPSIGDGQQAQVFTCPSNHNGAYVADAVRAAVAATAGQIVLHGDTVTAGFFVSGTARDANCAPIPDPAGCTTDVCNAHKTERYVTINVGKSGSSVSPSTIGNLTDGANRGAMGQLLSNCLAQRSGYTAPQILSYFYGADITIRGEPAVPPVPTPMENDPAAQPSLPTKPDPSGLNANPICVDPVTLDSTTVPCWSYTLQCWTAPGACIQSVADSMWYQCDAGGEFSSPVDPNAGTGPAGACTSVTSLSSN